MIQSKVFLIFRKKVVFTGVPDSILKEFSIYINKNKINHILATNEGSAVALANGCYLSKKNTCNIFAKFWIK